MLISFDKEKIEISSRRKMLIMGIIIAILNPIFSGLVISYVYLTEPKLKKEGRIILLISFLWALALIYIIEKFRPLI